MSDVAAFDFDGTLTTGGSVVSFLVAVTSRGRVRGALAGLALPLIRGAVVSGPAADAAKQGLFERVLSGVSVEHLDRVGPDFAQRHLEQHLRPEVKRRLDWHKDRGDRVVVVSASPEAYVAPAARLLGADGALATRLEVADGALTGRYDGANCRGEEKLRRLTAWVAEDPEQPVRTWAYGNSRGDLRMLTAADVGVNLGRLGRFGRLRTFPALAELTRQESG
jgi:phosphatidylglycerophosphatase C